MFNPSSSRLSGLLKDDHRDEGSLGLGFSCDEVIVAIPPMTINIHTRGPVAAVQARIPSACVHGQRNVCLTCRVNDCASRCLYP